MTHLLRLPVVVFVSVTIASAEERVTTVAVPGSTETVIAKSDSKGTIHVLYHDGLHPRYVSTMDSGQTFSTPRALVNREMEKHGLEYHVWDMAVESQGRVHVALGNNAWQLKLPQDEWGLFYTRLDPHTATFEKLRNINQKPSEGFSLAANDKGQVTACWMAGWPTNCMPTCRTITDNPLGRPWRLNLLWIPATAARRVARTLKTVGLPSFIEKKPTTSEICTLLCGIRRTVERHGHG